MCVSLRVYMHCVPAGDCEEQMRVLELPELELQAGHSCHVADRQYISALWKTVSHPSTHEFHILCHCPLKEEFPLYYSVQYYYTNKFG